MLILVMASMNIESKEPVSFFNPTGSKAVVCAFATPNLILTGHESGKVALFDANTGEEVLNNERAHMDVVTDLQLAPDRTYFVTSSKDKTARVCMVSPQLCRVITIQEPNLSSFAVTRYENFDGAQDLPDRDTTE